VNEPLRAAVIGVGAMGQHHVRAYREILGIDMVGFADADEKLCANLSFRYSVRGYNEYHQLLDDVHPDLLTVAVPTALHFEVASEAIRRGIHVLIEKPIAETEGDGQKLIDLAREHGVVLAVGHIERHNPAIIALKKVIEENKLGTIFEMRAQRIGPFPARIRDVGVVLDLATHDIDILCHLAGGMPLRVYAETQQNIHSTREDMLNGMMRFTNGITATLEVNWLTPTKSRRLSVLGAAGMYEVDYITQDLTYFENGAALEDFRSLQLLRGVSEGRMIRERIEKREPLRLELEDFIGAIREGYEPRVTGGDSLAALRIAHALVESGRNHQVVEFTA
jgi:UDP-N-acetylglucosamine 3-dehydrogenase